MSDQNAILKKVNDYYSNKVLLHGSTPAGVDWNSAESQELRFQQLLKLIKQPDQPFSILDYGCGYGAMYGYMTKTFKAFDYLGYDISTEMIKHAIAENTPNNHLDWQSTLPASSIKDYAIASGVFNVKQEITEEAWKKYIIESLHELDAHSSKGFAFNALSLYSDKEFRKDYLHYADPTQLFDYCKKNFSYFVTLLHDYPLYEFTILVLKK